MSEAAGSLGGANVRRRKRRRDLLKFNEKRRKRTKNVLSSAAVGGAALDATKKSRGKNDRNNPNGQKVYLS